MTEYTSYECDMCGATQKLMTHGSKPVFTNYCKILRQGLPYNDLAPTNLCPDCTVKTFDWINEQKAIRNGTNLTNLPNKD